MRITFGSFGGIIPRYLDHQLPDYAATIAHDCKLRNGRLEAWREPCEFADVPDTTQSFHLHGCCVVPWDSVVYAAETAPDWGRFYITGRTNEPEVCWVDGKCEPHYAKLGVPAPPTPPSVNGTEKCGGSSDARLYVYTYVNRWGEEGPPSPPSNVLTVADGDEVLVTGLAFPPEGYEIVAINIYRAASGFRQPDVKQQKPMTEFLYVGTVELPSTSFVDNVRMAGLGAVLETAKVHMPPACLSNIVALDGVVRFAGSCRNKIYVSENFQPYNWPVKYELTLDSNVVHLGAEGQTLYVTTNSTPYTIDLSSCEDAKCTPVTDGGVPLPDISCMGANGSVMTPHGLIYSSPLGLVLLNARAQYHIITKAWFSETDWAQVHPETACLAYWEGFLFCSTQNVTFMLNINTDPYGDMKGSELVTLSDKPTAFELSNTGTLFFLQDGKVWTWDKGDTYRPYLWESKELSHNGGAQRAGIPDMDSAFTTLWSPASVKIRTEETTFRLITPFTRKAYERIVTNERPFRLPFKGRHMWFKFSLTGTHPVEFVDIGTAHSTVNAGV